MTCKGHIEINYSGSPISLRVHITDSGLVFLREKERFEASFLENKCHCRHTRVTEDGRDIQEITVSDYKDALCCFLGGAKKIELDYGEITHRDLHYYFTLIANGFVLELELDEMTTSYAVVHVDGHIVIAKQDGEWNFEKNDESDIIKTGCEHYLDAMKFIYQHARDIFRDFSKKEGFFH